MQYKGLLIMAFLALGTTDVFYSYAVHLVVVNVLLVPFVYAVKPIVFKVNFCCAVAIDTPTHA